MSFYNLTKLSRVEDTAPKEVIMNSNQLISNNIFTFITLVMVIELNGVRFGWKSYV